MTLHTVATVDTLSVAFAAALDGDVIELAPGTYGAITLSGRHFETGIVIRSADPANPAVFTDRLELRSLSNVDLENIDIHGAALADGKNMPRLFLRSTTGVELRDIDVTGYLPTPSDGVDPDLPTATRSAPLVGYGYEIGIRLYETQDTVLRGVAFDALGTGLYVGRSGNVLVEDSRFTGLREGIQFFDTSDMTVRRNDFRDFNPWLASIRDPDYNSRVHDHADMIQYWGANSIDGLHRITISDNHFEMPEGSDTQTIFGNLRTGPEGITATDFSVTGNTIINGHPNAIRLGDIDGGLIADNVLLPNGTSVSKYWSPTIELLGARNVDVRDNAFVAWTGGFILNWTAAELAAANITLADNTLLSTSPTSPDYWVDWLARQDPGIDPPQPDATQVFVDGTGYDVLDQYASGQGVGSHKVLPDGAGLTLTDNAWKSIEGDFRIGADTVLSFTFDAAVIGEIHGIGFDNGDGRLTSPGTLFKLAGTQSYGIESPDWRYAPGAGAVQIDIEVGKHFTGRFDRMVFIMDDDAWVGADSTFSDIRLGARPDSMGPPVDAALQAAVDLTMREDLDFQLAGLDAFDLIL